MKMRLGPFIGHTTDTSTKIWLRGLESEDCYVTLFESNGTVVGTRKISFTPTNLYSGIANFEGLKPDTRYNYRLHKDDALSQPYPLDGLADDDLHLRTMPGTFDWDSYRYDFLVLSCNNPKANGEKTKTQGYEMWSTLPKVMKSHEAGRPENQVRFVLMGGDQVYADDWKEKLLSSATEKEKIEVYFEVYATYWSDIRYRRVLASLPAYLMWDDHDIMDGWGSEKTSFLKDANNNTTTEFTPEWQSMFLSARQVFHHYQSARNAEPFLKSGDVIPEGFDMGFRIGPLGFVMADLRSNRNWEKKVFWTLAQVDAFKKWVNENKRDIEVLFFLTPVVIAHGSPVIEDGLVKNWDLVIRFFDVAKQSQARITRKAIKLIVDYFPWFILACALAFYLGLALGSYLTKAVLTGLLILAGISIYRWAKGITRESLQADYEKLRTENAIHTFLGLVLYLVGIFIPESIIKKFEDSAGDLRDDIRDSWAGEGNGASTDELLQFLFDLQNDPSEETRVQVVILSGDIHAGGCSNVYSEDPKHQKRAVIPHIVSSPVGYSPFPWIAEAIYRKFGGGRIKVGDNGKFYFQSSHHFTERNVVICSIRKLSREMLIMKTKFYVEGFPEPQTQIFDLERSSKREEIAWSKGEDDAKV